jgi:hypothetical protein
MTALSRNARGSYLIDGTKYPSVTTILGSGVPKPALTYWSAKCVAEAAVLNPSEWIPMAKRPADGWGGMGPTPGQQAAIDHLKSAPWRDRDKGANLGSALHRAIECQTLGLPMPEMDEPCTAMVAQYNDWAERYRPTWELSEATVYSPSVGYAGTTDGVMVIDGKRYIVDLKTTKPGRQGHGLYNEVSLQLAAYRFAEFVVLPNGEQLPMPEVDGALGIWVRPDVCRAIHVKADLDAFRGFLSAFAVAQWVWADDVPWVGSDLAEPTREVVA